MNTLPFLGGEWVEKEILAVDLDKRVVYMLEYVDLKYVPSEDELICEYYVEPASGISVKEVCSHLAGESSIDTWTDILTLSPELAKKFKPHVFYIKKIS